MLWSFVYLVVRNLFALVLLVGRSHRSNEMEILVLRHELAVLRRQVARPRLSRADRALLAALSRSLRRTAWPAFLVQPETLLRRHRELVARRWTYPGRLPGRPPLDLSLRTLILRLARENPRWGYRRIVGELKGVGISVSATSVRKVLLEARLQPAPERGGPQSWRAFLRAQAASMLACDFLTVETAFLQRIYVLFFISLETRRIEYIACTLNPDGCWAAQQARNLVMQLGDEQSFRFLVRDRDAKFSHAFDEVFRTEGIRVIRTPVRSPNANAYRQAVGADSPLGLPRSDPDPRPPPSGARARRLPPPLQRAQAAPRPSSRATRRLRPNTVRCDSAHTPPRSPWRANPRIQGRLSLRTLWTPPRRFRVLLDLRGQHLQSGRAPSKPGQ